MIYTKTRTTINERLQHTKINIKCSSNTKQAKQHKPKRPTTKTQANEATKMNKNHASVRKFKQNQYEISQVAQKLNQHHDKIPAMEVT